MFRFLNLKTIKKISLPWNEDTFTGWTCTFVYSVFFAAAALLLNAYVLSGICVICVQFHSFRLHFVYLLSKVNDASKKAIVNIAELKNVLSDVVQFHNLLKK